MSTHVREFNTSRTGRAVEIVHGNMLVRWDDGKFNWNKVIDQHADVITVKGL